MIHSPESWRAAWDALHLPASAVPTHPDLGALYPWPALVQRACSSVFHRRVQKAKERIAITFNKHPDCWVSWSAGKDSTVVMLLCEDVCDMPAMSQKDDFDFPGETEYITSIARALNRRVDVLTPPSIMDYVRTNRIGLTEEMHAKTAEISKRFFYKPLLEHRQANGYSAVMLGLRAQESRGRRMNNKFHGWLYTRKSDGLTVSNPISEWETCDVHAYLAMRNIPILPSYLCVDINTDPWRMRKSWFAAGGDIANLQGHYVWLRRWWPDLWERIADLDPEMRRLS